MPNADCSVGRSFLVPLTEEGNGPPLFLIPAAGCFTVSLLGLARALHPKRTIYTFMFAGMENDQTPPTCIEEMASTYMTELRAVQGNGPYYLGGHCFGGIAAFEMAAQLEAEGESVAVLIPIGSFPPASKNGESSISSCDIENTNASINEQIEKRLLGLPAGFAERIEESTRRQVKMEDEYRAKPINAPIAQLRSCTHPSNVYRAWANLTTREYTERVVPGDTYSMLDRSNLTVFCNALQKTLEHFR